MTADRAPMALGAAIRGRRLELGLTLVEVGRRSGLSHPFLSQVERDRARLSLESLGRVCRALGTSEVELFWDAVPAQPAVVDSPRVVRAAQGLQGRYGSGEGQVLVRGATAFVPIDVRAANRDPGPFHLHAEDEFVLVVEGWVQIELADRGVHRLDEGDAIYLDGGTPHRWCTPDGEPYRLFLVKQRLRTQPVPGLDPDRDPDPEVPRR